MKLRVVNRKDLFAGLFFLCLGLFALMIARGYQIGTTTNMGPGYFPVMISLGLILLGAINCMRSFDARMTETDGVGAIAVRPLIVVPLSVLAFAILIDRDGLVFAVVACVVIARFAVAGYRVSEVVILSVALTAIAGVLFVIGLGLPPSLLIPRW